MSWQSLWTDARFEAIEETLNTLLKVREQEWEGIVTLPTCVIGKF